MTIRILSALAVAALLLLTAGLWRPLNAAPEVALPAQAGIYVVEAPADTTFTATASDPDGQIVNYEWDFGDGGPRERGAELAVTRHVYTRPGDYPVRCVVTDDGGAEGSAAITMRVVDTEPPTVTLVCPREGAQMAVPVGYEIVARLTASDNVAIRFLRVWNNLGFVADLSAPPYELRWRVPQAGEFTFTVYAIDTSDKVSRGVTFKVTGLPCQ